MFVCPSPNPSKLIRSFFKSQKYHLDNPYWKTFDPYVVPLLDRPMDLRRHEELDTTKDVEVPL